MNIHNHKQSLLLKRLPNSKLSYENIHKKVFSDMYVIIPKGKKHLVWFTYFEDKKVCIFIEINQGTQKNIRNMFIVPQIFEKKIVLGTLFYGTLFNINSNKYFSIENIHYYKGKSVEHLKEKNKLILINDILTNEIKSCILGKNGIALSIPVIENSFQDAINTCKNVSYDVYSIQNRNHNSNSCNYSSTLYKKNELDNDSVVFSVKADIKNDIYNLYFINKVNELEKYDIAAIPDYKTSKMMNDIFRTIKENNNLDALEESDDEDEFENMNDDKYVDLNKCVNMECVFNNKYNKYIPLKKIQNKPVVCKSDIIKR